MTTEGFLDLIRKSLDGDRAAFDRLSLDCNDEIRALIAHLLGRDLRARVDVEDLHQETLLRAFRSIRQFRAGTEDGFRGWLKTIARHAVEECGRKMRAEKADIDRETPLADRRCDNESEASFEPALTESETSPSRLLEREERYDRLRQALDELSDDHREVIVLARLRGLPMKEVAARMNRSPNAAAVLLFRAMMKLRHAFGETDSFRLPERCLERDLAEPRATDGH